MRDEKNRGPEGEVRATQIPDSQTPLPRLRLVPGGKDADEIGRRTVDRRRGLRQPRRVAARALGRLRCSMHWISRESESSEAGQAEGQRGRPRRRTKSWKRGSLRSGS